MDYGKINDYFNYKKIRRWTFVQYISYGFIALSVLTLIITTILYQRLNIVSCLPSAAIGVALLLTSLSMITSESYLKQQLAMAREGCGEKALEFFDYPETNSDNYYHLEWYDLISDDVKIRVNGNRRVYSTKFIETFIYITKTSVMVFSKVFSLVSDSSDTEKTTFAFSSLSSAKVTSDEITVKTISDKDATISSTVLTLFDSEGNKCFSAPIRTEDYDTDRLTETINRDIARLRSGK